MRLWNLQAPRERITAACASGAAVKTAHIKREGSNSDKLELIGSKAVVVPES